MSGAYQLFIRAITLTGLGFISYEIYESYKQEKRIRKLQAQRQYQISTGKEVDPKLEQEIDHYLDNHYGQRVLERMASRNVFEEQLRMQIQSKKDQRDQAKETGSEDQVKKLEEDIKKLNDLLGEVKSNKAVDVDSYGTMK